MSEQQQEFEGQEGQKGQEENHEGQTEQQQQQQQQQQSTQSQQKQKPVVPKNGPIPEGAFIIDFEVCNDCASHAWCTHHDENKYTQLYLDCMAEIYAQIPNSFCTYNAKKKPSTGAFEISHKGIVIFSKKNSQLFPQPKLLPERIKQFIDDLENKRDVTKWATKKEIKQEQPRQIKERPTFQTYMKQREEQERLAKEQKKRQEDEAKMIQKQEDRDGQENNSQDESRQNQQKPNNNGDQQQYENQADNGERVTSDENQNHQENQPEESNQQNQQQDQQQQGENQPE